MDTNNHCSPIEYLIDQYNYFDQKSISLKRRYYTFIIVDAVISTLIPFATLFISVWSGTRFIVAFMGSLVAIISIFISKFGFHEKWIDYRTAAEKLKYEKSLYESKIFPYDDEKRDQALFERIREIIDLESENWRLNELNCNRTVIKIVTIK